MTKTISGATLVLTIYAASVLAGSPVQKDSVQAKRLNPGIGLANPQQYKSIRNAKEWKNPYLVIRRDGIEVIASGLPSGGKTVASTDLQRALIDLAVTAWPYGRVVAVQDIGIRAADRSDQESIADNLNATLAILKTLQVTVERWPSA
jgi:hypothetical protein